MEMKLIRLNDGNETWSRENGGPASAEIKYFAMFGSKQDAMYGVMKAAPPTYGTLRLQEVRFDGVDSEGNIELSAVYAEDEENENGGDENQEAEMSFDCGGGTMRLTHVKSQKCVYAESAELKQEWANVKAIGWNGKAGPDSQIDGVEVPTAQMRETYTKWMTSANLTTAFRRRVASAVNKVNEKPWKGWEPGEALFLGCSFSRSEKGNQRVQVSFHFSIQPNESNVEIVDNVKIDKKGWQYLWSISKTESASSGPTTNVKAAFLADVCEAADFAIFGL